MKYIKKKYISLGFALVILSVITFIIGLVKWPFLIISAILLFSYIVLDRKELRCPNCGGFENLQRLSIAKNRDYYCSHCGEKMNVQ